MTPLSPRRRFFYFILFCTLFVAAIPFIIFYAIGYRFDSEEGLVQTGGIFINNEKTDVEVYVNQELAKHAGLFTKDYYIQDLTPGHYDIMITEKDHTTWRKTMNVFPMLITEADPYLLATKIEKREVYPYSLPAFVETTATGTISHPATTTATSTKRTTANPEFESVAKLFATTTTFTSRLDVFLNVLTQNTATSNGTTTNRSATSSAASSQPKIDQDITIYKDGKNVYAEWLGKSNEAPFFFCPDFVCSKTMLVYSAKKSVSHFDFFPSRNNLIVVADESGVYIVELDTRPEQNIQALYPVLGATFRVGQGGTIYIKDGKKYYALSL